MKLSLRRIPTPTVGALVATAFLAVTASPAAAQGPVDIVFASGPDDTGTVQSLLDAFNQAHRGEIQVEWRQLPRENDVHRRELLGELEADPGGIDLIASDVVWTAELSRSGYVEDLTGRFYDDYDREAFLRAPLGSATYRLRIWGVPWYTDAGLLFYRRDLLAQSGITAPPRTWDELGSTARRVMEASGTPYGFVFQGAAYEGGAANAAEFIWSAGGEVMTSRLTVTGVVVTTATEIDAVSVGSAAAARGLDIARGLVTDGVSPSGVADFREAETLEAFAAGEAVYMRNWPYAYEAILQAGLSEEQVGVAPLPAAGSGGRSASSLGGWNLMLNARSSDAEQDAAWTLVRYLTEPSQQRRQAIQAGLLPVLEALYDDPGLSADVPVIGVGREVFAAQLHERPMTPFYNDLSERIAEAFNRLLRGDLDGTEAAALLDRELRAILARNR